MMFGAHRAIAGLAFMALGIVCGGIWAQSEITSEGLIATGQTAVYPEWIKGTGMTVAVAVDVRLRPDGRVSEAKASHIRVHAAGQPERVQERALTALRSAAVSAGMTWRFENKSGSLPGTISMLFEFSGDRVSTSFHTSSRR